MTPSLEQQQVSIVQVPSGAAALQQVALQPVTLPGACAHDSVDPNAAASATSHSATHGAACQALLLHEM